MTVTLNVERFHFALYNLANRHLIAESIYMSMIIIGTIDLSKLPMPVGAFAHARGLNCRIRRLGY